MKQKTHEEKEKEGFDLFVEFMKNQNKLNLLQLKLLKKIEPFYDLIDEKFIEKIKSKL